MVVPAGGTSVASSGWARACQVAGHPDSAEQSIAAATAAVADSVVGLAGAVIGGAAVTGPGEGIGLDWYKPAEAWSSGSGSAAATR